MRVIIAFLFVCICSSVAMAQATDVSKLMKKTPLDIPDISLVGTIEGNTGRAVRLSEVELSIQSYLYPSVRADVFLSIARDNVGAFGIGVEEAYITATNYYDSFGVKLGTKKIEFGKINGLHPEQWGFASRPAVLGTFLGSDGLVGEGAAVDYLFSVPFFLQAQFGSWQVPVSDEPGLFSGAFYSARLASSWDFGSNSELSSAVSAVFDKETSIYGLDVTYVSYPESATRFKFQNELLYLISHDLKRWGGYSYVAYRLDAHWEAGLRFDVSDSLDGENERSKSLTAVVSHSLTETSKLRLETGYDLDNKFSETSVQFIFGVGPHSHAVQ
ncbi:MAG: hypothetical protein EXS67_02750 [Candidatus Margulisbacteria bacterium]|nr:hypothetical protein [Candidatus Margulisiibacteriota bacterium]